MAVIIDLQKQVEARELIENLEAAVRNLPKNEKPNRANSAEVLNALNAIEVCEVDFAMDISEDLTARYDAAVVEALEFLQND